jgi:hypothetical protein
MKRASLFFALIIICCGTNIQGAETIWAVGGSTILRNDDGVWQTVSLPDSIAGCGWRGVWGSASNDVYVAGFFQSCPPPFGPCEYRRLLHYDGADWSVVIVPDEPTGPSPPALGIDGTGADNIYVVGGWGDEFSAYGFMFHFDGSAWSISWFPDDQPQLPLRRVWADPSGGFYAVGECWDHLHFREYHAVYHYLPSGQWIKENPRSGDDYFEYDDISGFGDDLVSVPGMIYANYELSGNVIHAKSAGDWYKLGRADSCGSFWVQYPHCPLWPARYRGVWCASPTDIWSCGDGGNVLHWTPSGYTQFSTPTTATLNAIWGTSNTDVYAVGNGGTIVHYNGTDWSLMESGTTQSLFDVHGTPAPATGTVTVPIASFALNANYPNPFNPSTTIGYSIPARGRVTLRIYDATGKLVRGLLDEEESAGAHSIMWNGLDDRGCAVSSGAYFCRMEFGKASMSRKILLVR